MEYQIQSDDIQLQIYEKGNMNSNTIILFLHGGPGSGAEPLMALSAFQSLEETYHCIYFDQRGTGKSVYDVSKGLLKQQLVKDVAKVVKHCKTQYPNSRLVLWGGSFGGLLACLYMEYEGNVDALILSSPAITFSREQAIQLFHRNRLIMEKKMPYHQEQDLTLSPEKVFENIAFHNFIFSSNNPSNALRHMAAMAAWFYQYDATTCLSSLQIPTLIMIGEDDVVCDANILCKQLMKAPLDKVIFHCIGNCGHAVFEDQKDKFLKEINSFLEAPGIDNF